ncbi:hypothetical protein AB3S75_037210 [Citrus x aurantiifolia]
MWSPYEKCKEIVKKEWMEGISWKGGNLAEIFKRISKESLANLRIWSIEEFEGRKRKLQQLKKKLKDLKNGFCHLDSGEEIRRIEMEIDNILLDEEVYWKQSSRADWLKEGDKNTLSLKGLYKKEQKQDSRFGR